MPTKNNSTKFIKNITRILFLVLLFAASAVAVFLILFDLNFSGKIYPRVSIAGQDLSTLDPKTAQQIISNNINSWQTNKIQVTYSEPENPTDKPTKEWQIDPAEIGLTFSAPKTILKSYNLGRIGNPIKVISEKINIIAEGKDLPIYYDLEESKLNGYIGNNFSFLEKSNKNASLIFINDSLAETPSENGYKIDKTDLKNKIELLAKNLTASPVPLKIVTSYPDINDQAIKPIKDDINSLLGSTVFLRFENKSWILNPKLLKSAIVFNDKDQILNTGEKKLGFSINPESITPYLEEIQLEINRNATDAVLDVVDGKLVIASGGESGIALNIEASAKKISEEILNGVKNKNKNISIDLAIKETEAAISQKTLDKMNITALIGQGKSNFAGSPKNRRYNINVGAAKFNNVFIAPDEEFSFVKTLGEVTSKAGYLPELVIKGDKTIPELGGGLCQVSTTAFRAAIYAGLPILERRPHSYPVAYYNPQGMDATIYPPHPDLRFKNDTGGPILIQTKIVKNDLTFNFFGVKQDRTIKVIGPNIYDRKPDGSLKSVFWREIYKNDELIKKETFNSSYSSPNKFPHKNPLE